MDMILKNTFQSTSSAYELIGDVTVGTIQHKWISQDWILGKMMSCCWWVNIKRGSSSSGTLLMACDQNGTLKTTMTDYYFQSIESTNTTTTGYSGNANVFSFSSAIGNIALGISKLKLTNSGYFIWQNEIAREIGGTSVMLYSICGTSTFATSSITQLRIYFQSDLGGTAATGSRFQLYKLVAEKVADIIVPSNTTSVDITGLDIGKGGSIIWWVMWLAVRIVITICMSMT